ncbi:MAG: RsmD family RNA methyltransferase [Bacteroidetes bacterium]|nr:RsmD family RNA methyltransferase [Bacteroidota bacterium]
MRIIHGTHKGRLVHPPKNLPVRPTTDFAKESIFNILNNHFEFDGLKILDLFCGTGNISYEFASRGCGEVTCVDSSYHCCDFIKKTAASFKMDAIRVVKSDVFAFLKRPSGPFHIVFCDPPYDMEKLETLPELVFSNNLLKPQGWLIEEHGPHTDLSKLEHFSEHRKYGNVNFSIFTQPAE